MTASIFPGATLLENPFASGSGPDSTRIDSSAFQSALAAASRVTGLRSAVSRSSRLATSRSTASNSLGRLSEGSPCSQQTPAPMLFAGAGAVSGLPGSGFPGSSRLIAAAAVPAPSRRRQAIASFSSAEARVGVPLALAAVLLCLALLVAPEQPRDQEAICQRHNGVAACRVW